MELITSFKQAKQYLERFHEYSRTEYTLDNMLALMEYLGHPEDQFKAVHVAGTSGKTSTAYYASALLTASGNKVGLTVSPHIVEINERLQINGQPIAEAEFCQALTKFLTLIEKSPVQPSWFEAMVAFAYWYFDRLGVDYAVVEVGLGGLKDGTNVLRRPDKVCVITDIGLDHLNVLGSRIEEIAAQKIGIVHPSNTIFTYQQSPEIMDVLTGWVAERQAELRIIDESQAKNGRRFLEDLPQFQRRNWLLAYQAFEYLTRRDNLPELSDQKLLNTQEVIVPGRMDTRKINGKTVIMDGAHNAQKMAAFTDSFKRLYPGVRPAVLLALKEGKELQEIAPLLGPLASRLVATTFEAKQDLPFVSTDPGKLADAFKPYCSDIQIIPDQKQAFENVMKGPEEAVLITGSFYLISQLRDEKLII